MFTVFSRESLVNLLSRHSLPPAKSYKYLISRGRGSQADHCAESHVAALIVVVVVAVREVVMVLGEGQDGVSGDDKAGE